MRVVLPDNVSFDIAEFIPGGHENAITRKELVKRTGLSDREIRDAIQHSEEPIINLGKGYFIAKENEGDLVQQYVAMERSRIRSIAEKLTKFTDHPYGEPEEERE